jgi:mono/diheme cytochrome c family protein
VQPDIVLQNPGSPVVTSRRRRDAIVWVLDPDKPRSAALYGADAPRPVLYAVDAETMALLWRSPAGQLHTSGKYNEPVIARGTVFVGTDRLQAFGLWPPGQKPAPFTAPAATPAAAAGAAGVATDAALAQGRVLYLARCAPCHDQGRSEIPSRATMARHPAPLLIDKMARGSMQGAALGLDDAQLQSIADWLATGAAR